MSEDAARSTRDKAADARAAAAAEERRRRTRLNALVAVVIVVLVGGLVTAAVLASRANQEATTAAPSGSTASDLPATVLPAESAYAFGFPVGTPGTLSTVEIWTDFQCPYCAIFEATQAPAVQKLAEEGKIYLVYRPATFLDANFPQSDRSSARATSAWGCAIDAGVGVEYHSVVFANQPEVEGAGYTNEQLVAFGATAGITGEASTTFAECVNAGRYLGWATRSEQVFESSAVPGTPAILLDGDELPGEVFQGGDAAMGEYIDQNRKK